MCERRIYTLESRKGGRGRGLHLMQLAIRETEEMIRWSLV